MNWSYGRGRIGTGDRDLSKRDPISVSIFLGREDFR